MVGCPSCYLAYARQQLPPNIGVAAQNCYKVSTGSVPVLALLARLTCCVVEDNLAVAASAGR